jgi:tetratricopeptide (TPR) repeat protein
VTEADGGEEELRYDAFISYARDERETIVRPLYEHLTEMGLRIWFDEIEVKVGDSIHGSINRGMRRSDYGIVVLSEGFLERRYPIWELEGFLVRQLQKGERQKVLLPLYYGVDEKTVSEYSYPLANLHALTVTEDNVEKVAERLYEVITEDRGETVTAQLDRVADEDGTEAVDEQPDDGDRADAVTDLVTLGDIAYSHSEYATAREKYELALETTRKLGNGKGVADSLDGLGRVAVKRGEYAAARDYHGRGLARSRDIGYREGIADGLNGLGNVAYSEGEYAEARDHYERSLELSREIDYRECTADDLNGLGNVAYSEDEYADARDHYERSLELSREIGYKRGVALSLQGLGNVAYSRGNSSEGRDYYERGLELYRELGDQERVETLENYLDGLDGVPSLNDLEEISEHPDEL